TDAQPGNDQEGITLLKKAADAEHVAAQYDLGVCYERAVGVREDLSRANVWWEKAARQGHVDAQYKLAHSYRMGRGVDSSPERAFYWYGQAAQQWDVEAQYNLGLSYWTGFGTTRDLAKAIELYQLAAQGGNIQARAALAQIFASLDAGPPDYQEAYKWLLLVVRKRHYYGAAAQLDLEALWKTVESHLSPEERARAQRAADTFLKSYPKENAP
ncbi:MAG: sel1 repeat family protein, partial [Acidobacteriales bacterium]|nr:sel1 repeat family protein [Terriglobales bacterium]